MTQRKSDRVFDECTPEELRKIWEGYTKRGDMAVVRETKYGARTYSWYPKAYVLQVSTCTIDGKQFPVGILKVDYICDWLGAGEVMKEFRSTLPGLTDDPKSSLSVFGDERNKKIYLAKLQELTESVQFFKANPIEGNE